METPSKSVRNPARAGQPFNAQSKFVPRDVSQETKDAACARNQEVIREAKLGRTESRPNSDNGHDAWLNYVRGKLERLEDC